MVKKAKNYSYRMTIDRGFAPNVRYGICTLSGCKDVIERCAQEGSWVIGVGGDDTDKQDKLIYAMEVEENLSYRAFKKRFPGKSKYLKPKDAGSNVLISKKFYYFGDNAVDIEEDLKHIIKHEEGCKCISDKDINKLKEYLLKRGYKYYGIFGRPNNMESSERCGKC